MGTRGSRLALAQTEIVLRELTSRHPETQFETVIIKTSGDSNVSVPAAAVGVGIFIKELETALAEERIDLAVHSAKDLPSEVPSEFAIAAVLKREDPRDALVSRHSGGLSGLPRGAHVATGSPRRKALLLAARPDLSVEPLRGNVDTRLLKLHEPGGPDAVLLAAAGLARLGRTAEVSEMLDPAVFVPAVSQGALAIETRAGDPGSISLARSVQHHPTRLAIDAERSFLAEVGGGCSAPVSAHATLKGRRLLINSFAASEDGSRIVRNATEGESSDAEATGRRAAAALLAAGARSLLGRR
jgi:hydroxymethylbilane synthase